MSRCGTQRQLADERHAELQVAGAQFRLAVVALTRIFSSRYCPAIESAAFFVDGAQPRDGRSGQGSVGKDQAHKASTIALLSKRPAAGHHHFMMAHRGIFWAATGLSIQQAHAVVLDPGNLGVIVARIAPERRGGIALAMAH